MDFKTYAIETFEIAQWNVLKAIFRLHPEDFTRSISPDFNDIRWMIGHLTNHMDSIFNYRCQGKRVLDKKMIEFFSTGAAKAPDRGEFPLSIKKLIDFYLEISNSSIDYLTNLAEEKFDDLPDFGENNTETIIEMLQRITLHLLGHVGQIYNIKRMIGKGGYFVAGVKKKMREDSKAKWLKWWNDNKEKYT
ncbi:MAG: DinB family protein [Asgard group archaeon]|nr:DinB family protein [Asgard group archaeon]